VRGVRNTVRNNGFSPMNSSFTKGAAPGTGTKGAAPGTGSRAPARVVVSLVLAVLGGGAALASGAMAGCGSDAVHNPDYGLPPDASYDTGNDNGGSQYGSGSGSTTMNAPDAMVTCAASQQRCMESFTFPNAALSGTSSSGITGVELRGDYRAGAWDSGDTMSLDKTANVWTVSVPVPAGSPVQYKFYVTGASYCNSQGMGSGPCWISTTSQPTVTLNGNTNNYANPVTCDNYTCAAGTCGEVDPPSDPTVYDWRDSVMYFVFVDRFLNGNTSNDNTPPLPSLPSGDMNRAQYQGGDWQGVINKINDGYFTDLGVNTLWITVPMKNDDQLAGLGTSDSHLYSAYHGYWSSFQASDSNHNPTIEDHFGSLADLKTLVTTAHGKNLKIVFDYELVSITTTAALYTQHQNDGWWWPNDNGMGGNCICGQGCDWNNNFPSGTKIDGVDYSGIPQYTHCWFASYLPHWNYTNADARAYSEGLAVDLATSTGADGFRIDAVKHIDPSWTAKLRTDIIANITSKQTPAQRFYMVGETFEYSNRDFIKSFIDPDTSIDGQFDFPERGQIAQSVLMRSQGMDALESFMSTNDGYYCTGSTIPALMSTFIGNHDMPRAIGFAQDTPVYSNFGDSSDPGWNDTSTNGGQALTLPTTASAFERVANAEAIILTNQGVPLIYYGDEIGMPGGGDPDNRRMMYWSEADSTGDPDGTTGSGWTDNQKMLFARVKALISIRAAHPALRRGHRTTIEINSTLWVYQMQTAQETVYVAVNAGDTDQKATGLPSGLTELLAGDASGTVPARQTRIYVTSN
jgi:glycosidase